MNALKLMLSCEDCRYLPGPLAETVERILHADGDAAVAEFLNAYHAADHDLEAMQDRREGRRG